MIRVGFGCTALAKGLCGPVVDGIGQTTANLYDSLRKESQLDLVPICFGYPLGFSKVATSNPGLRFSKFSYLLAFSLATRTAFYGTQGLSDDLDLFHSTDHYVPKLRKIPILATVHDAIPMYNEPWMTLKQRLLTSRLFRKTIRWADRIITVSHFSKEQIMEYLKIPEERITVVMNGVASRWFLPANLAYLDKLKKKHQIFGKYIISVGTLQPRKNFERLLKAYEACPKHFRDEFGLVIVGRNGWGSSDLVRRLKWHNSKYDSRIRWLDSAQDFAVETLVKGASSLIFPSLAEGFGLPLVEAFAAGVPVVASDVTSIPEVANGAAVLVNPYDVESIAEGMTGIVENEDRNISLRQKGLTRAKELTWEAAASQTLRVYRSMT